MTQHKKNAVIGTIILLIVVGVPLAIALGPIALFTMAIVMIVPLFKKDEHQTQPKRDRRRQKTDELIAVILPTINTKK